MAVITIVAYFRDMGFLPAPFSPLKTMLISKQNSSAFPSSASLMNNQRSKLPLLRRDDMLELALVLIFLATVCAMRINLAHELYRINIFDQFNIFFDADPVLYVMAFSEGWGFSRIVHPGFGLMFNLPIRALAFMLDAIGIAPDLNPSRIRVHLALAVAPICSAISGLLCWQAAHMANFSPAARCASLVILQASFSTMIFSVVPESYGVSGMLYSVLLVLTIAAIKTPETLSHTNTKIIWLILGSTLAAVTITNALPCIIIWMLLRFPKKSAMAVAEGVLGLILIGLSIATMIIVTQLLYPVESKNENRVSKTVTWSQKYMNQTPRVAAALPASYLSSIIAFTPAQIPASDKIKSKQDVNLLFSLAPVTQAPVKMLIGWLLIFAVVWNFIKSRPPMMLSLSIATIFIFNSVLHSMFGPESFLYSQHWIVFLTFLVVYPWRNRSSLNNIALITICVVTIVYSLSSLLHMTDVLFA